MISLFVLVMMNVSIMVSLRNLPLISEYGYALIAFFVLVGLFFLIPCLCGTCHRMAKVWRDLCLGKRSAWR